MQTNTAVSANTAGRASTPGRISIGARTVPTGQAVPTGWPGRPLEAPQDLGAWPHATSLHVVAWPDPLIDSLGHDPRSNYAELFWLPILGPSTMWLLRRIALELELNPEGLILDLPETARSLGLGARGGKNSPFQRALSRCITFEVAQLQKSGTMAVRRMLPPLSLRHLARLSDSLRQQHVDWQQTNQAAASPQAIRQRSRQLAMSLLDLGEDAHGTELQLIRWRFHPALACESTAWAIERQQAVLTTASDS